ncbi:sensor histidine kinase [Sphingoaurantiacus capsulatus]|uniref:Sensor histidine kinase n=1 Tax=Sphingoaurantiacus capsulatus TaxID=1771310 RepID=A0ABV7X696_9SPHN
MTETYRLPDDLMPGARTIAIAWGIVALAYTPPVLLMARQAADQVPPHLMFVLVAIGFMPWALATRPLIQLCARWPLGAGERNGPHLLRLALVGLAALPTLALVGTSIGQTLLPLLQYGRFEFVPQRIAFAATINAFFSVPTYVAVVGVGQALVYVDRTRTRERLLARARLEALRAQIDPHFLFNALGAIAQLAHRGAEQAEAAIGRLSDVLRSTLASDDAAVPLSSEIATVMDHVELHRMLMPSPLDLRLSIAPAAWGAMVPALILQPLVENAVTHGLSRLTAEAWLAITAEAEGQRLVIEVRNARPTDAAPSRGLGIGLRNVGERLEALFGSAARLTVAADGNSFTARIELPLDRPA